MSWFKNLFPSKKEFNPSRRGFLKKTAATALVVATTSPLELFARIMIKKVRVQEGETFEGIVRRECDLKTLYRYYGTDNIFQALNKLAKFNGINKDKIRPGMVIRIPIDVLKRAVLSAAKKTTQQSGFQSPFGGKTKPVRHRCPYDDKTARICPYDEFKGRRKRHHGLDLRCLPGTKLYPILPGKVQYVQPRDLYLIEERKRRGHTREGNNGKHIIIRSSGGYRYIYLHLSKTFVKKGDHVTYNTCLGLSGTTGNLNKSGKINPHVHIQLQKHGFLTNPLKYLPFLK